jgi:acyl-CoA hydrolase
MSEINLKALQDKDIIEIGIDVVKFGTSSLTLKCEVRNMMTRDHYHNREYNYGKPWSRDGKPTAW